MDRNPTTLHNEDSYLAHIQGKKQQTHLALRVAKEACTLGQGGGDVYRGCPGPPLIKQRDVEMDQQILLFLISLPETTENMSHNCFLFA